MPRSTYSKIFDVLTLLGSCDQPIDIDKFIDLLRSNKLKSFEIFKRNPSSGLIQTDYCSEYSVKRLLSFMNHLELVKIPEKQKLEISAEGRNGLDADNFPTQLSTQLVKYLRRDFKIELEDINVAIRRIEKPDLPFIPVILMHLSESRTEPLSEDWFRKIMYLLERCGEFHAVTRKAYSAQK